MFETRSECSFFRMASSSSLLNLAPGTCASTSDALLAQSKKADATKRASRERSILPRFWSGALGGGCYQRTTERVTMIPCTPSHLLSRLAQRALAHARAHNTHAPIQAVPT